MENQKMRRVKSAPENIAMMSNRKKVTFKTPLTENAIPVPPSRKESKIRSDIISEAINTGLPEVNIVDPTEQMFVCMIFKGLMNYKEMDWKHIFREAITRLLISFVSHKIMMSFVESVHVHSILHPP